jgi:hypothetical protein
LPAETAPAMPDPVGDPAAGDRPPVVGSDGDKPPVVGSDGDKRALVVLDVAGVTAPALAGALDLPPYEAGLVARRGGLHLYRVLPHDSAEAEAARLRARGLATFVVPEAEARVRPVRAVGGERGEGTLTVRTEEEGLAIRRGEVMLVVRGPITRVYQTSTRRRRVDTARLDEGYRVHLHRRGEARPVEIDAAAFEFGFAVSGSARLEIDAWAAEVAGGAPCDDGFRRLPPALGPTEPEPRGPLAAASSLGLASRGRESGPDERPVVLDNVAQFRFYSGWRAAVERRR